MFARPRSDRWHENALADPVGSSRRDRSRPMSTTSDQVRQSISWTEMWCNDQRCVMRMRLVYPDDDDDDGDDDDDDDDVDDD